MNSEISIIWIMHCRLSNNLINIEYFILNMMYMMCNTNNYNNANYCPMHKKEITNTKTYTKNWSR